MKKKTITEFEWLIMRLLWEKGVLSVKEVWQTLFPGGERAYTTIQTIMDRMVKKRLLQKKKIGLVNFYRPRIDESTLKQEATQKFVNITFNGSFGSMAAFLLSQGDFSHKELEEIKKLIDQKEGEINESGSLSR
ncbi:MAG: BlaI/MecI/CopY family transcriptional regulator [Calditrichaeota bacterium]|nr:BlaI/MecI/CopY family transcriptional regulator [Calditrichota bacterium]